MPRSGALAFFLVISLTAPLMAQTAKESWQEPGTGLAEASVERSAVLLMVIAPGDPDYERSVLQLLDSRSLEKAARGVGRVRLELRRGGDGRIVWPSPKSDEPTEVPPWDTARVREHLERGLGLLGEGSFIAILDNYGRPLVRYDDKLPGSSKLRKALTGARQGCAKMAKLAEWASVNLAKAGVAIEREMYADACRIILSIDELVLPRVAPEVAERDRLRDKLEKKFRKKLAAVEKLEMANKLGEAASGYEKMLQEFPIPRWQKTVRERVGRVWRKILGPNPPGGA